MACLQKFPESLKDLDYICGVDEAGRGSLSGPVFAGAVILPKDFESDLIRDSKKLSEKKRNQAFELIKKHSLFWTYYLVEPKTIDEINIQRATHLAMVNAVFNLDKKPDHILVDGNSFEDCGINYTCVIKGDDTYLPIAAASIVAKVIRDEYMTKIHKEHPNYNWQSNKGYGSKEHIQNILDKGVTNYHRMSFLKKILN